MHRRPERDECMRRKLSELELEANEGAPALHVCVIIILREMVKTPLTSMR